MEDSDDGALFYGFPSTSIFNTPSLSGCLSLASGEHLAYLGTSHSRLYSKGRVLGHKRSKRNSRPNTSLLQIEGVANKEDAQFYLGKVSRFICTGRPQSVEGSFLVARCLRLPGKAGGPGLEGPRNLGVRVLLHLSLRNVLSGPPVAVLPVRTATLVS